MQNTRKNQILIYLCISLCLFIALVPAILSNNYLRQDDLKTGIWLGMRMSDEGYLYYNTVYQLVRPVCMCLMFLIDLISTNIHHAVYIRLASILTLCGLGILLYRWQLFFNSNRILAASFAIAAFTLPGIQLFVATANYFLIIFGILLAVGGPFYWYKSFNTQHTRNKIFYLLVGSSLLFLSFLDYPLSSMYVWVLLAICYLNSFTADKDISSQQRRFFYYAACLTLAITFSYFIFMHIFHWFFQVNLSSGRVGVGLMTIFPRIPWVFPILEWHSLLWVYLPGHWLSYYPLVIILALLFFSLIKVSHHQPEKIMMQNLVMVPSTLFILFLLCYLPSLAAPEDTISYTFRYTVATMPLLLYTLFWSMETLGHRIHKVINLLFISVAVFGMYYCNLMLADGIVGPQTSDFNFLKSELHQKVVPLLKQNKLVLLHVINCESYSAYHFEKDVPDSMEYGMRLCVFPTHIVGAVDSSLRSLGYSSNKRKANSAPGDAETIILNDVPWGNLIVSSRSDSDLSHMDHKKEDMTVVTIDMRAAPAYKHLDFYRHLLGK